jgi:hypothetical protein
MVFLLIYVVESRMLACGGQSVSGPPPPRLGSYLDSHFVDKKQDNLGQVHVVGIDRQLFVVWCKFILEGIIWLDLVQGGPGTQLANTHTIYSRSAVVELGTCDPDPPPLA